MSADRRWVVDTNVLISRLLLPGSIPARAVDRALGLGDLLVSGDTLSELARVLGRPKFDRYVSASERRRFFELLGRVCVMVQIVRPVAVCRDPGDDAILAVAVNGRADAIVTGDEDLLSLHPFLGIPVLAPKEYLEQFGEDRGS